MGILKLFTNIKFQRRYKLDILKLNGLEEIGLNYSAYKFYKSTVRGRSNVDYETAKKILFRDLLLSEVDKFNEYLYHYGNLSIIVNKKRDCIIYIHNSFIGSDFVVNNEYKEFLNRKLGIVDTKIRRVS